MTQTEGENKEGWRSDKLISPVSSVSPSENITVSPLIDAELANTALQIREMGRKFLNYGGQTAEQWLAERGL